MVLAGGALLGVIALVWGSVQSLTGEADLTLDEALGLGAPTAQEEQKRAVLRALKDLEYERSVGKVDEADYAELRDRYRADARRLLEQVDAGLGPARSRAEKLLEQRLTKLATPATEGAETRGKGKPSRRSPKEPAAAKPPSDDTPHHDTESESPEQQEAPTEDRIAEAADAPPESPADRRCGACDTPNDADATFCKACGTRLEAP
jgi:hypothetical protein